MNKQLTKNNEMSSTKTRRYKKVILRKQYIASIPVWRRPLVGYFMSIVLVGVGFLCASIFRLLFGQITFPGAIFFTFILLTALFWGVGPAIVSLILSTLTLDYFFMRPINQFDFSHLSGAVQLVPFVLAGLVIAIITGQREEARWRSIEVEQELQSYTDELEEANRRLKDTDQLKDHFLSIASHELKTPITSIKGQAQIALRRISKQNTPSQADQTMRSTLEKIDNQTTRLTSLIDELMDVSSIRAGKVQLHKSEFELVALCQSVVEDQQQLTNRSIEVTSQPSTILIFADRDRILQVMTNLVTNAIKYSPEKSEIGIFLSQNGSHATVEVQDHGRGIADKQLPHIFDTFYRTPDAQSSAAPGLGLGLAICKDIVERHDGRIWAESRQGKGSTFFVELPKK